MSDPGGSGPGHEVLVEAHGAVRLVVLNRPDARNAVDEALQAQLAEVWPALDTDANVRAIVLTGAGSAFSGGGDLDLMDRMTADRARRAAVLEEAAGMVRGMAAVRVPIVAAVNGPAVGLGCTLASLCDLVVIEEQAHLADPHVPIGLVAGDGGAVTWPLLIGLLRAKEHLLLGDRITADEAVRLGIANRVVPTGTSREVALELARRLAAMPPQAVRETKALLHHALRTAIGSLLDRALAAEAASFDEAAFRDNLRGLRDRSR